MADYTRHYLQKLPTVFVQYAESEVTMRRQRTWKQYRAIDLGMFAVMLAIFEYIIVRAANWWFPGQPYVVSLAAPVTAIVYMRWGPWGAIHAVEAGIVFCFFSGADRSQYVVYCVGNLLSLLSLFMLKKMGKEKVRETRWGLVFPVVVLLLMQAGRAAVAFALGAAPPALLEFFTTDSLSYVFTLVIVWIARKLDGIYEDQKHYLVRIHTQEEEKGGQL